MLVFVQLLSCRGLEAGYGASQVLFGVDLEIAAGEVVTLLGRNGMGKSTTIKALTGGLRARRGEIYFDGHPIHHARPDAIARLGLPGRMNGFGRAIGRLSRQTGQRARGNPSL